LNAPGVVPWFEILAILPKSAFVGAVITPLVPEAPEAAESHGWLNAFVNSALNWIPHSAR
jgi:hypothetical protein